MRLLIIAAAALCASPLSAEEGPVRARDLGIPFSGEPGPLNAITDVAGVAVGHETIIRDLAKGRAVRTGVSAILPRGDESLDTPSPAAIFSLNGNGEMTGAHWVEESGFLEGPIMITNTHSVGAVHDGTIRWRAKKAADSSGYWWSLPVVAETYDGHLNDINGFHVEAKHVSRALESARGGPVAEGNVGGGTGMICHEFKCGVGTASRRVEAGGAEYTLGAYVQANYGIRDELRIAGAPVGKHLRNDRVYTDAAITGETGSIIIVLATDAPLLPHQLKRLARRASMGLARMGSYAGNGSGDVFVAFSTAPYEVESGMQRFSALTNSAMDPLLLASANAVEEAIVNALIAAEDMTGDQGRYAKAIDHDALVAVLKDYNRLETR